MKPSICAVCRSLHIIWNQYSKWRLTSVAGGHKGLQKILYFFRLARLFQCDSCLHFSPLHSQSSCFLHCSIFCLVYPILFIHLSVLCFFFLIFGINVGSLNSFLRIYTLYSYSLMKKSSLFTPFLLKCARKDVRFLISD